MLFRSIYKYLAKKYTATTAVFFAGRVSMCSISAAYAKIESGTPVSNIKDILGNIILVAISKKGGKVIIPKSDTVISEGDELFIIGETEQIQTITAKQGKHINETNINNVMLLGGGKTAFFLGKMLLDFGINVKIIDNNRERCQYLSSHSTDNPLAAFDKILCESFKFFAYTTICNSNTIIDYFLELWSQFFSLIYIEHIINPRLH